MPAFSDGKWHEIGCLGWEPGDQNDFTNIETTEEKLIKYAKSLKWNLNAFVITGIYYSFKEKIRDCECMLKSMELIF